MQWPCGLTGLSFHTGLNLGSYTRPVPTPDNALALKNELRHRAARRQAKKMPRSGRKRSGAGSKAACMNTLDGPEIPRKRRVTRETCQMVSVSLVIPHYIYCNK
jgi:hypothetical protein